MFNKTVSYLGKAIKSNTGVSSLSLLVVVTGIIAVIILLTVVFCMIVEIIVNSTIASSLEGYASIIREVALLLTSVVIPKAINNYGENKYRRKKDDDFAMQ